MDKAKISYAGVGAAVAGVIGILGIYSAWWETDFRTYNGTVDISGQLALAMSVGLFDAIARDSQIVAASRVLRATSGHEIRADGILREIDALTSN